MTDEPAREAERLKVGPLDRRRVCVAFVVYRIFVRELAFSLIFPRSNYSILWHQCPYVRTHARTVERRRDGRSVVVGVEEGDGAGEEDDAEERGGPRRDAREHLAVEEGGLGLFRCFVVLLWWGGKGVEVVGGWILCIRARMGIYVHAHTHQHPHIHT